MKLDKTRPGGCEANGNSGRLRRNENISRELLEKVRLFLEREWIEPADTDRDPKAVQEAAREAGGFRFLSKGSRRESRKESAAYDESAAYGESVTAPLYESSFESEFDDEAASGSPFYGESVTAPLYESSFESEFDDEAASAPFCDEAVAEAPVDYGAASEASFYGEAVAEAPAQYARRIDDIFAGLGQTFQQKLLSTIDAKGMTDAQVYTKANLDRRLFSKIRCNINYKPSKSTVLALAIALGLNLDETTDLLSRAGLALSPSSKADLIVKYCIINKIHDILDVNAILYEYDQPLLGC